jgi:hypothetical protein
MEGVSIDKIHHVFILSHYLAHHSIHPGSCYFLIQLSK